MPHVRSHPWKTPGAIGSALLRHAWLWLLSAFIWGLSGCAQLPPSSTPYTDRTHWSGRLALQIEEQPSQSFSASFELQGSPEQGELLLLSPLGSALAHLQWAPGRAMLVAGSETRFSDSLDELLQQTTGMRLPIAALFYWLNGTPATAGGWQADLSGLGHGRLTALRHTPEPRATLRIALDR